MVSRGIHVVRAIRLFTPPDGLDFNRTHEIAVHRTAVSRCTMPCFHVQNDDLLLCQMFIAHHGVFIGMQNRTLAFGRAVLQQMKGFHLALILPLGEKLFAVRRPDSQRRDAIRKGA